MSLELFTKIIDQLSPCQPTIKLYHSGEPFLNKDIFKMIEYAHTSGCKTMIHTNATLLDREMTVKILESSLDHLSFSFDGCSREIYEKLRLGANFDLVVNRIEYFLAAKKRRNTGRPYTVLQIIEMKETKKHIQDFINLWEKSGIDEIDIQTYMTWLDEVEDHRTEKPKKLIRRPCDHIFNTCSILSDGTVVPCSKDVNGKLPMGNVNDKPIKKIWDGEKYQKLREQHLSFSIPESQICFGCDDTWVTGNIDPNPPDKF
jgi:radical SAM protein with 4Fe4S-binding SPASM domain